MRMAGGRIFPIIAWVNCVTILLVTTGIPLPAGHAKTDEEFPCRNHGCGCRSAEMCRKHCCCFKHKSAHKSPHGCPMGKHATADDRNKREQSRTSGGLIISALECKGLAIGLFTARITLFLDAHVALRLMHLPDAGKQDALRETSVSQSTVEPLDSPPRSTFC